MSTDLKITQQETENRQLKVTIVVPEDRVEKALRAEVRKLGKRISVPGFRPGKAPFHLVVQRYGRDALMEGIIDDMGQGILVEALDQIDIQPFAVPILEEAETTPLTYHIVIPLAPEVDPGDYRQLRVPLNEIDEEAVQQAVQAQIEDLRGQNKTWQPVERPIAYGDLVTASLKITVNDEVVLENDDWDFIPDESDYTMAPDFDAAFIDMQIGEGKTFSTDIPEDANSAWAGSNATFEIEVKGIKGQGLPALDDAFAQEVSQYGNYEEMLTGMSEAIREKLQHDEEHAHHHRLLDALREQATLNFPPVLVDERIDFLVQQQEEFYKTYGIESTQQLLTLLNKTKEQYRAELEPQARKDVEIELLYDKIAALEQFEISDYECHKFLEDALQDDSKKLAELSEALDNDPRYRAYIELLIKRGRAGDLVAAIAKGEEVPAPGEHPVLTAPLIEDEEAIQEEDVATDESEATSEPPESTEEEVTLEVADND